MRSLLTIVVLWVTIMMAPAVFAQEEQTPKSEEQGGVAEAVETIQEAAVELTGEVAGATVHELAERTVKSAAEQAEQVAKKSAAEATWLRGIKGGTHAAGHLAPHIEEAGKIAAAAKKAAPLLRACGRVLGVFGSIPAGVFIDVNTNIADESNDSVLKAQEKFCRNMMLAEAAEKAAAESAGAAAVAFEAEAAARRRDAEQAERVERELADAAAKARQESERAAEQERARLAREAALDRAAVRAAEQAARAADRAAKAAAAAAARDAKAAADEAIRQRNAERLDRARRGEKVPLKNGDSL